MVYSKKKPPIILTFLSPKLNNNKFDAFLVTKKNFQCINLNLIQFI